MGSNWLIGIDLGGTKTEVILMDRQSQEHYRQRVPTSVGNYQATLQTIHALVQKAEAHAGTTGIPVGIGIPGSVSSHDADARLRSIRPPFTSLATPRRSDCPPRPSIQAIRLVPNSSPACVSTRGHGGTTPCQAVP